MFLSCPEFDILPIFLSGIFLFCFLVCFLTKIWPENSREIGRFLREFVSSNPVKFHFFPRELSEALYQRQNLSEKLKHSKNPVEGSIKPPTPPLHLYHGGGVTLLARPRVNKIQEIYNKFWKLGEVHGIKCI